MLRLGDIMTRELAVISPDCSLREAAELLVAKRVSGVPVVEGTRVLGVLSLADLIEFQSTTPGVPSPRQQPMEWGEEDDEAAGWEDDVEAPSAYYSELWTDAGAEVVSRFGASGSPEWDVLSDHLVSEAMSGDVQALSPCTRVDEAADFMRRKQIHRVLVMEDGQLAGIVSTMDITNAVADHKLDVNRYVFPGRGR